MQIKLQTEGSAKSRDNPTSRDVCKHHGRAVLYVSTLVQLMNMQHHQT